MEQYVSLDKVLTALALLVFTVGLIILFWKLDTLSHELKKHQPDSAEPCIEGDSQVANDKETPVQEQVPIREQVPVPAQAPREQSTHKEESVTNEESVDDGSPNVNDDSVRNQDGDSEDRAIFPGDSSMRVKVVRGDDENEEWREFAANLTRVTTAEVHRVTQHTPAICLNDLIRNVTLRCILEHQFAQISWIRLIQSSSSDLAIASKSSMVL